MSKKSEEKSRTAAQPAVYGGEIHARIIDAENGFRLISGVYAVRIRSLDYNLLIMEDYLPTLGKIDGDIVILTDDGEVELRGVHGFYKHQHNEFTLLVDSQDAPKAPKASDAPKAPAAEEAEA